MALALRSTRSKTDKIKRNVNPTKPSPKKRAKKAASPDDHDSDEVERTLEVTDEQSDAYEDSEKDGGRDSDDADLDSDALDDDNRLPVGKNKRKRASTGGVRGSKSPAKTTSPRKASPKKSIKKKGDESDDDLEDGQEVVGVVVQAPKSGRGALFSRRQEPHKN